MAQKTNQTQVPILCTTGCGFYGNPRTNGMCSICYKDSLQRQNSSSRVSDPVSTRFSTLGESLSTQSNTVTATSALQLNSSQSIATAAETAQEEPTSGETQDELKTEEVAALGSDIAAQSPSSVEENSKPQKKRCFICRKKLALTDFSCRCDNFFCGVHRCSNAHNCPYDYKAEAAEKIRKENPVVAGEKIPKI